MRWKLRKELNDQRQILYELRFLLMSLSEGLFPCLKTSPVGQLLRINRRFYQEFAEAYYPLNCHHWTPCCLYHVTNFGAKTPAACPAYKPILDPRALVFYHVTDGDKSSGELYARVARIWLQGSHSACSCFQKPL